VISLRARAGVSLLATQACLEVVDPLLQGDDVGDARQVEALGEELTHAVEPVDVVGAVQARPARRARGSNQATAFVDAEVLDLHRHHLGRDGDREHAATSVAILLLTSTHVVTI
jgi:hypothetical protein